MKCVNCGFEQDGWIKVTSECETILKVTSTEDKMGYIILKHKEKEIGSFTLDNENPFQYYAKDYPHSFSDFYKVLIIERKGYHTYFEVYMKKNAENPP